MKFTVEADAFRGRTFEILDEATVTWLEAGLIERVTGFPFGKITDDRDTQRRASVHLAFLWVSICREVPGTTYSDVQALPVGAYQLVPETPDEPAVDTADPPETGDDTDATPTGGNTDPVT